MFTLRCRHSDELIAVFDSRTEHGGEKNTYLMTLIRKIIRLTQKVLLSMIRCDQESLLLKVSENENVVHMLSLGTHAGDIGSHLASQCTFFYDYVELFTFNRKEQKQDLEKKRKKEKRKC